MRDQLDFRAYDKRHQRYVKVLDKYPSSWSLEGEKPAAPISLLVVHGDMLLLWWSGFEDRNGVKIYAGDKLRVTGYLTCTVWYRPKQGAWYYGGRRLTAKAARELEVIGNHYRGA